MLTKNKKSVVGIFTVGNSRRTEAQLRAALKSGYTQPILFVRPGDVLTDFSRQFESMPVNSAAEASSLIKARFPEEIPFFNNWEEVTPPAPEPKKIKEHPIIQEITSPVEASKYRKSFSCDVIIPYSGPNYRYLDDAIKSILNQNFVTTTIHLINDGMERDPVGQKYARLENVRLYKNVDGPVGPYITYSRLFDYLEHDFIANQDSDDIALPMRLYKSLQILDQGFDIVGGAMEQFVAYEDGSERMRQALTLKPYHFSGKVYAASPSGAIVNSTAVMKKSVYEACNGMAPWTAGADSEFYQRCITAGFKAVAMQEVIALRRLHNPSLSNDQVNSGHGSHLREEIKRLTAESIERQLYGPDHSIGGLAQHRNDTELQKLN
ncbi:glycosyltransferase [Gimesia fumaroli]|uniref:Glycosyl transferase family 2 n=1 Tax=Gimesia fumaroli TaxID=2527976 RepID=A0A518ICN3_9PLAN|nr:glycosyltransferase [Gimesia fumaroli]QDV50861.1 Glycosyl transferase family 2 [Gimesia fumaroli]